LNLSARAAKNNQAQHCDRAYVNRDILCRRALLHDAAFKKQFPVSPDLKTHRAGYGAAVIDTGLRGESRAMPIEAISNLCGCAKNTEAFLVGDARYFQRTRYGGREKLICDNSICGSGW
jgi:hypothetical protein